MRRLCVVAVTLILCLPASSFGQSQLLSVFPSLAGLMENVKVNPYVQVGYQWVGANLNLPVQNQNLGTTPIFIDLMDISLQDASFWSGVVGFNVLAEEKYSLFAAAGGILGRPFVTAGILPISVNGSSTSATFQFTDTNVESWFVQTGIGLGPVLLGLYWNYLGFELIEPQGPSGPIPNQSVKGNNLTKTFAPFVGLALPAS